MPLDNMLILVMGGVALGVIAVAGVVLVGVMFLARAGRRARD